MILDTNAVAAILAGGKPKLTAILQTAERHHLPLAVIGEYQFGMMALSRAARLKSLFRKLEAESFILLPDRGTADVYAMIRHELKMKGRPIPENDLWIAAMARQHSLEIVSQDSHFDQVEGIRRVWW